MTDRTLPDRSPESRLFDPRAPLPMVRRGLERLDALSQQDRRGEITPSGRIKWSFVPYGRGQALLSARRPAAPSIDHSAIPAELKQRRQWVCWEWRWHDSSKVWKKVPISPITGDSPFWPRDRGSYYEATAFLERTKVAGLGFCFTEDDPFVGVDVDDCRDPVTGQLEQKALDLVALLDSYTEVSPSGTGLHILVRGTAPQFNWDDMLFDWGESLDLGEPRFLPQFFEQTGYLTMTGDRLPGAPPDIRDRRAELFQIEARFSLRTWDGGESPMGFGGQFIERAAAALSGVLVETDIGGFLVGSDTGEIIAEYDDPVPFMLSRGLALYDQPGPNADDIDFDGGLLRRVDLATGRERWRVEIGSVDDLIDWNCWTWGDTTYAYACCGINLLAVHHATGDVKWRFEADWASLDYADERLIVVDDPARGAWGVDPTTGNELWVGGSFEGIADGLVLLYDTGRIEAVTYPSGEPAWTVLMVGEKWETGDPVFAREGQTVFVAFQSSGHVLALDLSTGKERWHADVGKSISDLLAIPGAVVAVTQYALHAFASD